MPKLSYLTLFLAVVLLSGCGGAAYHKQQVALNEGERMTVGTVQREIRVGMSGGEVASVLGSPNIVSTDEDRREVWIYDKISTTGRGFAILHITPRASRDR